MVASPAGPYGGINPPRPIAGSGIPPYGYGIDGLKMAMTANLVYYVPFIVTRSQTFAGLQFHDQGTGNNGMHIRAAVYGESASGGPGALVNDWGAATLTGTAALHQVSTGGPLTLAASQTPYYHAIVSDSTPEMFTMGLFGFATGAGAPIASVVGSQLFDISGGLFGMNNGTIATPIIGWTASMTYGAFASTAPTPSANITNGVSATIGTFPGLELYS